MRKARLAVLISGRGSNLKAIIDASRIANFPAEVVAVISNKADAKGIDHAINAGIPHFIIPSKNFASKEQWEEEIISHLNAQKIDLVCLAGFMRILSPHFFRLSPPPVINIHPSLLPKYKGLHTHERALEAGDKVAGCTVHFVTEELDAGDIILQREVQILANDTPDTLAERVLEVEHNAYPDAISLVVNNMLSGQPL